MAELAHHRKLAPCQACYSSEKAVDVTGHLGGFNSMGMVLGRGAGRTGLSILRSQHEQSTPPAQSASRAASAQIPSAPAQTRLGQLGLQQLALQTKEKIRMRAA